MSKFWLRSKTVGLISMLGGNAALMATDPSMSVGSALAYLLQFGLGMALSHGTDVNRPDVDVVMLGNVLFTLGTAIAGVFSRKVADQPLRFW